jgi:hypothetical protein
LLYVEYVLNYNKKKTNNPLKSMRDVVKCEKYAHREFYIVYTNNKLEQYESEDEYQRDEIVNKINQIIVSILYIISIRICIKQPND